MSAFDVGAFVNGDEPPATKLSRQEKKRKTDTSRKKGGKGKEFEKKPVPKEVKPETDSMLALKLQAELNGGNRDSRNRKPMLEGEEGEGEEEEWEGGGAELQSAAADELVARRRRAFRCRLHQRLPHTGGALQR